MTDYASLAQVKSALRITDNLDDAALQVAISAASELIDGFCGRNFGSESGTRVFAAAYTDLVLIDDLVSLTTFKTDENADGNFETTWVTGIQQEPLNHKLDGTYWPTTRIRAIDDAFPVSNDQALIQIEGVWGWASVPASITEACIIQACRLFKRADSPLGVAGFSDVGVVRVTSKYLDGDVAQLLQRYRLEMSVG